MSEFINYKVAAGIATIQFNRADKFNSVIRPMAMSIQEKLNECDEDDSIRCVVLTGSGKAFCAGQDLIEATDTDSDIDLQQIVAEHYNPIIKLMRDIEKPILVAVNGVAAGAGANIALAGDIIIAKQSATFIQAFSKIGLIPDSGGTYHLPRLIGWQKASALMMLGDQVQAEDAEKMGMIYKVYEDSEFAQAVENLSQRIASMPTRALALTKKALNKSHENTIDEQLDLEEKLQSESANTEDYEEGVNAFIEKRKPNFKGQ